MEKSDKKRILTRVLIVIAALTLLSCCFLGSTFAKYVTNANGSASVGVAKWDIDVSNATNGTVTAVTYSDLSPSLDAYVGSTDPRTHEHEGVLVTTIQNKGEVLADITINLTELKFYSSGSTEVSNWGTQPITAGGTAATKGEAAAVIKLQFAYNQDGTLPTSGWKDVGTSTTVEKVGTGGSVYVFIRAIWVSYDTATEIAADALDTWLGENVESVGAKLELSAIQASEAPNT